jgi:acylphosphatase
VVKRARFVVRGRVQGVNFRTAAAREATARGITGRVWNRDDGAVECVAEGDEAALESLARWLRRGPRFAEVESVDRTDLVDLGGAERRHEDFSIGDGPLG